MGILKAKYWLEEDYRDYRDYCDYRHKMTQRYFDGSESKIIQIKILVLRVN